MIIVRLVNLCTCIAPVLPPLQGGSPFYRYLGLKPQAQSLSPFGTKFDRLLPDLIRARIDIRKQIIEDRLGSELCLLDGTFNLIVDLCFDLLKIGLIRVTVR